MSDERRHYLISLILDVIFTFCIFVLSVVLNLSFPVFCISCFYFIIDMFVSGYRFFNCSDD